VRGHLLVFASYLLLSAAWSWPTCLLWEDRVVTRQFDLYPTIWLVHQAPAAAASLYTSMSAWPHGESLVRADSYLLLFLGWLFQGLLPARVLVGLFTVVGPAVSAFAAERCAGDGFGVARPWSWVAGVVYGFAGIAAAAVLEGHVYQLLDPWLPLLWWAWARGRGWRAGLLVGAGFAGALLTSAYLGLQALVLLAVLALAAPRKALALAPGVAAVALPAGGWLTWVWGMGGGFGDGEAVTPARVLVDGTLPLSALAGWSQLTDLVAHSVAAPVGWTGFALLLLAPVALRVRAEDAAPTVGWRAPFALALAALAFTLGRTPAWDHGTVAFDPGLEALTALPGVELLRFPARASWLYALIAGVVGARVLAAGARSFPRLALLALPLVVLDAVVGSALPWRLGSFPGTAPSAYAAAPPDAAVLDLYGRAVDRSGGDLELWTRALGCHAQVGHGRPILEVCLGTGVESPRETADRWLTRQILGSEVSPTALGDLGALGVGAVAVHLDTYRPGDAAALREALTALFGAPAAESTDGGERVVLFRVPPGSSGEVDAAWARVVAGGRR